MTAERKRDQLASIAKRILSASEKVDGEEALSAGELRAVEALGRAHPQAGERLVPRRVLFAAAALLLAAVGILVGSYFSEPSNGRGLAVSSLVMRHLEGVRSRETWTSRDPFAIEVQLSADAFLYLLHLDSEGELEILFPDYDPDSGNWSYLGREDGFVPAGTTVSIPDPGFEKDWTIVAPPGSEEFFIAFATAGRIEPAKLLALREELRGKVSQARREGIRLGAIASRVAELIGQRFPGAQSIHSYKVD